MRTKNEFKFGTCRVPDGESGPWKISAFEVDKRDALMFNISHARNPWAWIEPGTYRKLSHATRGTIMSNTPMEVRSNYDAYLSARGRVLVNGLGMGMLLEGLVRKPSVTYIRVHEIDEHVIKLVAPHFARFTHVEIRQCNALDYKPSPGERYDYVWHDIWDDINDVNLPQMAMLNRRWNRRIVGESGTWSRDLIRAMS
jgi:hypothetical protein